MEENNQTYCLPKDHPCFAGHFPNNPIVPGVIILNYAQRQLLDQQPHCTVRLLRQAKFLHPLRPEQTFTINLMQTSEQKIKFTCYHNTQTLVTGTFIIQVTKGGV